MLLIAGALATLATAIGHRPLRPFATVILVALLANAAATGALSGPHHRYQARIAWLAVLPPLLLLPGPVRWGRAATPARGPGESAEPAATLHFASPRQGALRQTEFSRSCQA